MIERINPPTLRPSPAYTQVVVAEGPRKLVYLAGQTPVNAAGEVVGKGDLRAQTRQVYENLAAGLKAAGATFADVVKITQFFVNYSPADREAVQGIREEFMGTEALPASTLLGVQALANPDYLVEIEVVAAIW